MYNGIGLATARGSGTNAYVQKNLSFTNKVKQRVEYKTEEDIKKLDATVNRPANQAILAHQRKRQIELKCLELRVKMEEQGYAEAEIDEKVASYRETLRLKAEEDARQKEMLFKFDENGRPNVKETHQMAEINQERSDKLKKALGISPSFVEGSSLDGDRRAKESIAKNEQQQQQKYNIVENTPSPELPKQIASKVNVVEKRDDKQTEKSERKRNKSGEKNKEKRSEPDNEKPKKEIPKKYAYDDRKHKRSRSRSASKSRDRRDKYSKDYKRSGSSARYRSRSKRSRRDSESSRSSRERERGRRSQSSRSRSRSSSYSQSSVLSSSSSSSFSSSQSSHNSSSSYSSRGKSPTRSPPIRRRRGSPNFLEKRRITSARKRPVPYHRRSPSSASDSLCSASSDDSCFSSLSSASRKRCDWRRSSHTSTTNSLTELT